MCPSPSISASLIISSTSSSVSFSPRFVITCLSSAAEISPFPSLSNTLNASISYSSVSVSFIFLNLNSLRTWPSMTKTRGNRWSHCHQHPLHWSCPVVMLRWGFDPMISSQFPVPESPTNYLCGDRPISVFIKQSEGLFELSDLFFVKLVCHFAFEIK